MFKEIGIELDKEEDDLTIFDTLSKKTLISIEIMKKEFNLIKKNYNKI